MNDAEADEIRSILAASGEVTLLSGQRWGARWNKLEPELRQELDRRRNADPNLAIFGIELAGPNPWGGTNIDHHRYSDEDRSNTLSSIEQVAHILGLELSRHQKLIAANDRGYIPAMLAMGATAQEIDAIRALDRRAQGITNEKEQSAERDLARAEWRGRRAFIYCPDGSSSAHSDRLYGSAEEILLGAPEDWVYYGSRVPELLDRHFAEATWSGGTPPGGYFGITRPEPETSSWFKDWFFNPQEDSEYPPTP